MSVVLACATVNGPTCDTIFSDEEDWMHFVESLQSEKKDILTGAVVIFKKQRNTEIK